jgi:lipid-A-disaccharide synthase
MDREVVTVLIQIYFNKKRLKKELDNILNPEKRKKIFLDYYELEKTLGGKGASEKTAHLIYKSIQC